MKRGVILVVFILVFFISSSLVSASWLGDFWNNLFHKNVAMSPGDVSGGYIGQNANTFDVAVDIDGLKPLLGKPSDPYGNGFSVTDYTLNSNIQMTKVTSAPLSLCDSSGVCGTPDVEYAGLLGYATVEQRDNTQKLLGTSQVPITLLLGGNGMSAVSSDQPELNKVTWKVFATAYPFAIGPVPAPTSVGQIIFGMGPALVTSPSTSRDYSSPFSITFLEGKIIATSVMTSCTPGCSDKTCGDDGCGGSCGICSGYQICNAYGQCVAQACVPKTCTELGKNCGIWPDGCQSGGVLTCGTCSDSQTCTNGQCVASQQQTPGAYTCPEGSCQQESKCASGKQKDETLTCPPVGGNEQICCVNSPSPTPAQTCANVGGECQLANPCYDGYIPSHQKATCEFESENCCVKKPKDTWVTLGINTDSPSYKQRDIKPNGFETITPFDDVTCTLISSKYSDKTQTFSGKLVAVGKDGTELDLGLTGTLKYAASLQSTSTLNIYEWSITGWPDSWFSKEDSVVADSKTSSLLGKKVKCVVQADEKDVSSNIQEIGSCVYAGGENSVTYPIISMRGTSSGLTSSDLVAEGEYNRINGYGKISPFSENQDQFSYYIDLNNYDDSKWPVKGNSVVGIFFSAGVFTDVPKLAAKSCGISPSVSIFYNKRTSLAYSSKNVGGEAIFLKPFQPVSYTLHETGHALCNLNDEYYVPELGLLAQGSGENCVKDASVFGAYGDTKYRGCGATQKDFFRPSMNSIMNIDKKGALESSFNVISCGYCLSVITRGNANVKTEDFQACMNMQDVVKPGMECKNFQDCLAGMNWECINNSINKSCVNSKCVVFPTSPVRTCTVFWWKDIKRNQYGTCQADGTCSINKDWKCLQGDDCEAKNNWDDGCGFCDNSHSCILNIGAKCPTQLGSGTGFCNSKGKCTPDGK